MSGGCNDAKCILRSGIACYLFAKNEIVSTIREIQVLIERIKIEKTRLNSLTSSLSPEPNIISQPEHFMLDKQDSFKNIMFDASAILDTLIYRKTVLEHNIKLTEDNIKLLESTVKQTLDSAPASSNAFF